MWPLMNRCNNSCRSIGRSGRQQLLPRHVVLAVSLVVVVIAHGTSSLPLQQQDRLPLEDFHFGDESWISDSDLSDEQDLAPPTYQQQQLSRQDDSANIIRPYNLVALKNSISGWGTALDDEEAERPKRGEVSTRIKARIPVRRNGRGEIGLTTSAAGPILDPAATAIDTGSHSLQDLGQIRRAIRAWEAKLMWFAEKFADHPETLKTNPVWNKLMRIRNSLLQLAQAEEIRQSGLDETRM